MTTAKTLADESEKIAHFFSRISDGIHDILNDHTVVIGNCELALKSLNGSELDASRRITIAIGATGRATDTARGLLAPWDNPGAIELTDLRALILESEPKLRAELGGDVEIILELDEEVPPMIGSAEMVYRLLKNLCFNAREACANIPRPTISIALAERVLGAGNMVQLRFRDNGCGMTNEEVVRILAGDSFSTKGHGGMGMEIIRSVVRECGGQMSLSSVQGTGTAFSFLFPQVVAGLLAA